SPAAFNLKWLSIKCGPQVCRKPAGLWFCPSESFVSAPCAKQQNQRIFQPDIGSVCRRQQHIDSPRPRRREIYFTSCVQFIEQRFQEVVFNCFWNGSLVERAPMKRTPPANLLQRDYIGPFTANGPGYLFRSGAEIGSIHRLPNGCNSSGE